MMLLRARTLAMGYSGARPEVAETLVALLNAGITPVVPEHGSLGASGDLAPLAHCALAAHRRGRGARTRPASAAGGARRSPTAGIEPLTLRAKEGLALINGTDGILGMLVLACARLARAAAARRRRRRRCRSRRSSGPTAPSPPTSSRSARSPGRPRARRTCARLLAGSEIVASHRRRRPAGAGRLLAALRAAGARRRPRRARATPSASRPRSSRRRSTTR